MIKNNELERALKNRGAIIYGADNSGVHLRMSAFQAVKALETGELERLLEINRDRYGDILKTNHDDWCGGSLDDLFQGFSKGLDLSEHNQRLKEFEQGNAGKLLRESVNAMMTKKKLRFSEDSGDFDFARRFDDRPFIELVKKRVPSRIIEIQANFSFSCGVNQSEIDRFGVYVWALTRLIESHGYQARVVILNHSRKVFSSLDENRIELVIKEPGQYLSPSVLAAAFRCVFMRRALFAYLTIISDLVGQRVNPGLGKPVYQIEPIKYENDALKLSGDVHTGATEQVIKTLTQAFKH